MLSPTRTNLISLKDRIKTIKGSMGLLEAKRETFIREFMATTAPFVKSRDEISFLYGKALDNLAFTISAGGESSINSVSMTTHRTIRIEIKKKTLWGVKYQDVERLPLVRTPDNRGYDFTGNSAFVEQTAYDFERLAEAIFELVSYEAKLKRLGEEIQKVTRRIKALTERLLPSMKKETGFISRYLGEREREEYYRLKAFKGK